MKSIIKDTNEIIKKQNLYRDILDRYISILNLKTSISEALRKAPKGKIRFSTSNGYTQYYLRTESFDKSGKYLSKSKHSIIKKYIQKSYNEKVLIILNNELDFLSNFLGISNEKIDSDSLQFQKLNNLANHFNIQLQEVYSNYPIDAKKFIKPIDISDEEFINSWLSVKYNGKKLPENIPWYETTNHERVRSKSELNIANTLAKFDIPYKYECPLILKNNLLLFPDFTVLNVKERKEIYWEHRGMMDDRDYARHAVARNKSYLSNGLFIGKDLIITEETITHPLGTNEIEAIIKNYFQ